MQPSWVLGRRNYGDNGLLVELFTAEAGRCGVIARGVFRRKTGGSLASLLQPFQPLLVRLAGRGELKTLAAAESPTPARVLREDNLLSGLYLNELLTRLLPRFDPHPALFVGYGEAIEALQSDSGELALRRFELILLTELGYRIDWCSDTNQDPIAESRQYFFDPAEGFTAALPSSDAALTQKRIPGAILLAVGNWLKGGALPQGQALVMMKEVTRVAISQLTQGRTLNSRDIFRSLRRGPAPRDD